MLDGVGGGAGEGGLAVGGILRQEEEEVWWWGEAPERRSGGGVGCSGCKRCGSFQQAARRRRKSSCRVRGGGLQARKLKCGTCRSHAAARRSHHEHAEICCTD